MGHRPTVFKAMHQMLSGSRTEANQAMRSPTDSKESRYRGWLPSYMYPTGRGIRSLIGFFLLLGLLNGTYQLERSLSGRILDLPYTGLVTGLAAHVAAWILTIPVDRRGDITLGSGDSEVMVRGGCNGIEAIFLMAAGILAYPARWRVRGQALLIYLPALFVLNLLRVVLLLYVTAVHPSRIDFFHYQIGQGILVVFVFGFWVQYLRWVTWDAKRGASV